MFDQYTIAEHLERSLAAGTQYTHPFGLTLFKPFSDQIYEEILRNLPETKFYHPLRHPDARRPDGTSTRLMFSFDQKSLARLPAALRDFWSLFNEAMRSRTVCEVFLRHMEHPLTTRFGVPLKEIPCFPTARLGRDFDGYKILPHPDSDTRVYTAQVYLADDESQKDIGTWMYEKEVDGKFRGVRRLPFLPNTAFCFARSEHTFHGVEPVSLKKPRQNLHISCFHVDRGL